MGVFDKLGYFLFGSSDTSVSYGKKKTVDEIRKERVTLSNGSWNHTLREHLKTINCYDCRSQLSMVQTAIENAKKDAQFNYGTFIMENDVKEKYLQLLAEHKRQMAEKKKLEEEKRLRTERKAQQERFSKETEQSEQEHLEELTNKCVHILVDFGFTNVKVRLQKNMRIDMSGFLNKFEHKLQFRPIEYKTTIDDDAVILLAESLCKINLADKNDKKTKILDFYSKHGCVIQEVFGASTNNICVNLRGISSGLGSVYYYFDIYEFERLTVEKYPQIPIEEIEEFTNICKLKLSESGFSEIAFSVAENNKSVELMLYKDGIRYEYRCDFYSTNKMQWYDFTDRNVRDVVLNCILALNIVDFCRKQGAEKALRQYFEDNHYSYINVFLKDNRFKVFATKNKTKFGMQYFCESLMAESEVDTVTVTSQLDNDFDSMDGIQFEKFCAEILVKNGYQNVSVTSGSGDQGVDIIAFRDGIKYGIQCKCYSSDIGNKAVQEVYAGKTFYQCHVAVVMTNRYFTSSAKALANRNGVVLWDRSKLLELINAVECEKTL